MDTWEYRVVDKNGKERPAMTNGKPILGLVALMNNTPEVYRHGPYSVERRRVGVWEPVETKEGGSE